MIFCARNEAGEPTWKLVLNGTKTVTRRLKPLPDGKVFAVCPGRGKKAVCYAKVKSCMPQEWWLHLVKASPEIEAHREGFETWGAVEKCLWGMHGKDKEFFRIEFEVVR